MDIYCVKMDTTKGENDVHVSAYVEAASPREAMDLFLDAHEGDLTAGFGGSIQVETLGPWAQKPAWQRRHAILR